MSGFRSVFRARVGRRLFTIGCSALILLMGCGQNQEPAAPAQVQQSPTATPLVSAQEVVIGGVLPLTGDAAAFGENTARGAQLAVAQANGSGETAGVTFVFRAEDSQGNPAEAVSAARKLVDIDGAKLLIGDVTSAGTHAIIPVITQQRIPLVSPSASDPALSGISPFFARVWPSDVYEASVIGGHARERGYASITIVYANTDYGVAMVDEFVKTVPADAISARIAVERDTLDFRPTIERIRLSGSDAIFMVLYPDGARRFLEHIEEQKLNIAILATATFEDPALLDVERAEGVIYASPVPPDDESALRRTFTEAYKEMHGEEPGVLSDAGYDAANLLMQAYAAGPSGDPLAVIAHIHGLADYPGVSGTMTFDSAGDVQKPYRLRTVRAGQFAWLNNQSAE